MKLIDILEMVTSGAVGTNLIPQRWFQKVLRRPNLSMKDQNYYTDINKEKTRGRRLNNPNRRKSKW